MSSKRWDVIAVAVGCTALGLFTGRCADSRTPGLELAAAEDAAVPEADPHLHFSPEALRNLGVESRLIAPATFVREQRIAAVVEPTVFTERPVRALVGGRVLEVTTEPGKVVAPGDPLLRLVRASIPLPELDVTVDLLRPAHDEIHQSIRDLRRARADESIARAELDRVESFKSGDLPVVPGQRSIELKYQIERAQMAFELAEHELERHGLSAEQIAAVAAGAHPQAFGAENIRRALGHHGLWPGYADTLLTALPEPTRNEPLAVATIGELGAKGLLTAELVAWLTDDADAAREFVVIGALLLRGHALSDVHRMADEGGLEPEVVIRAPAGAVDWDVASIDVRPGSSIEPGDPLLTLRDPRRLRLRIHPLGAEVEIIARAAAENLTCRAVPVLPGTGPELTDLRIDYVASDDGHGSHAWSRIDNEPITQIATGDGYRSWRVRVGTAYELRVPVAQIDDALVLPRAAVLEDGPDRIVLVPHDADADAFDEVPVVVAYENAEVSVLRRAEQTRLPADHPIVVSGAFEIALAIHAAEHGAGGDHHHDH